MIKKILPVILLSSILLSSTLLAGGNGNGNDLNYNKDQSFLGKRQDLENGSNQNFTPNKIQITLEILIKNALDSCSQDIYILVNDPNFFIKAAKLLVDVNYTLKMADCLDNIVLNNFDINCKFSAANLLFNCPITKSRGELAYIAIALDPLCDVRNILNIINYFNKTSYGVNLDCFNGLLSFYNDHVSASNIFNSSLINPENSLFVMLIRFFLTHNQENRVYLFEFINSFAIKNTLNIQGCVLFVQMLSKIKQEEIKGLIEIAKNYDKCDTPWTLSSYSSFIKAFNGINVKDREIFDEIIFNLAKVNKWHVNYYINIINELLKIKNEDRDFALGLFKHLSAKAKSQDDCYLFIKILATAKIEDLPIIEMLNQLNKWDKLWSWTSYQAFCEAYQKIEYKDREVFDEIILNLGKVNKWYICYYINIINELLKIKNEDRDFVLDFFKHLSAKAKSQDDCYPFIKILATAKIEDLPTIEMLNQLNKCDEPWDWISYRVFCEAYKNIKIKDRKIFDEIILNLGKVNKWNVNQYANIINELLKIKNEDRDFALDLFKHLSINAKSDNNCVSFIKTLEKAKMKDLPSIEMLNQLSKCDEPWGWISYQLFCEAYQKIEYKDREIFYEIILNLGKVNKWYGKRYAGIINELLNIKKENRDFVLNLFKHLSIKAKSHDFCVVFLQKIATIKMEDLPSMEMLNQLSKCDVPWSWNSYQAFCEAYQKIEIKDREIFDEIILNLGKVNKWYGKRYADIINAFLTVNQKNRNFVLNLFKHLSVNVEYDEHYNECCVDFVQKIIKMKDLPSIEMLNQLSKCDKPWSWYSYQVFCDAYQKIEYKDREVFDEIILNLGKVNKWYGQIYANIINELLNIKNEDRDFVLNWFKCLSINAKSANSCDLFIKLLATVKKEDLPSVEMLNQLNQCDEPWSWYSYQLFCEAYQKIEIKDREIFDVIILNLGKVRKWYGKYYANIINTFLNIKNEDRELYLDWVNNIANASWTYQNWLDIINLVSKIKKEDCFFNVVWIKNLSEEWKAKDCLALLEAAILSKSYLKKNNFNLENYIFQYVDQYKFNIFHILKSVCFLPENMRNGILELIEQIVPPSNTKITPEKFILACWKLDNALGEATLEHWNQILASPGEDVARILADFITRKFVDLGLFEDHPLYQLACTIQIYANDLSINKNPYKIWNDLTEKRKEKVNFSNLSSYQFFQGENTYYNIALNPDFFQKLSLVQFDLDAVPIVDAQKLDNFFDDLQKRVDQFPALFQLIHDNTGKSFDKIRENVFSGDKYLHVLLKAAPEHKYGSQFKCIAAHYFSLDANAKDGELSLQDELFLKNLVSIFNCPTGKEGGISQAYALLPYDKKLKTKMGTDVVSQDISEIGYYKAYEFLNNTLQDAIECHFSGVNDLMCDLCAMHVGDIIEPVHQGAYLRNLIGDLVGSRYGVKFDFGGGWCYQNLLNVTRQQVVDKFYEYAHKEIDQLIFYVQMKINETITQPSGYDIGFNFVHLFEAETNAMEIKKENNQWVNALVSNDDGAILWESTEDGVNTITKDGVLKALLKIGAVLNQDNMLSD